MRALAYASMPESDGLVRLSADRQPRINSSGLTMMPGGVPPDDVGFIGGMAMNRKPASGGCRGLAAGAPLAHHRGRRSWADAGSCLRRAAAPGAPCGCR